MYTNIYFNVYLGCISHTKEPVVRFTKVCRNLFHSMNSLSLC